MQILILVLNKTQKLDALLLELNDNGIRGGTIIDSMGMVELWQMNIQKYPYLVR